jgi:putative hydrolase of the HAD superfamily
VEDALGVTPAQCVFVDDQLKNISGAEVVGMQVVHFDVTDPAGIFDKALRLLGIIRNV